MTAEPMPKPDTGVHRRGSSPNWQWRIKAPKDLLTLYATEWAHRCSLETADLREANAKAAQLRAQWTARFAEQRRELNPQRVERVTPEMAKLLAERVSAHVLGKDELLRTDPAKAKLLLDALRSLRHADTIRSLGFPGYGAGAEPEPLRKAFDPLEGMPLSLLLELADLNEGANMAAAQNMATQRVAAVLPLVQAEARSLGLLFDPKAPGAMDALRECLKAWRKAWQDVVSRDEGEAIDTPPAPTRRAMAEAKPTFLRDVLKQWKASKTRKPQTERAAENALGMYEEATGNPPLSALTRAQGVECRAWLLSQGLSSKTARDRFDYIKGFLNFASRELELLPRNPWEGLSIEHTTKKPRRPWSSEQLAALFSKSLFAEYDIPTDWHAGGDAAYWIPLLGIFTGARMGELCQLHTVDVEAVDGVHVLHITDQGDKSVKTEAGRRMVPVHSELIRLGFLEYVEAVKRAKAVSLWPALKLAPSKPSNYFSAWFKTLRAVEGAKELPDFHSFRHTVRSKLASASVAEPMIDTLCGHEVSGSEGAKTYTARTTDDLRKAVESIQYHGLIVPRVFDHPVRLTPPAATRRKASTPEAL